MSEKICNKTHWRTGSVVEHLEYFYSNTAVLLLFWPLSWRHWKALTFTLKILCCPSMLKSYHLDVDVNTESGYGIWISSVRPSIYLSVPPSVHPTVHTSVRPSVRPSIHPSNNLNPSENTICSTFACHLTTIYNRAKHKNISWVMAAWDHIVLHSSQPKTSPAVPHSKNTVTTAKYKNTA